MTDHCEIRPLTFDDIDDLPNDLLKQLNINDSQKLSMEILKVVNDCGGVASLDQILIGLYQNTGLIHVRTRLNSKIFRLTQHGSLRCVKGKKAVYSLTKRENDND